MIPIIHEGKPVSLVSWPDISPDGRFIVFYSQDPLTATPKNPLYVFDRKQGSVDQIIVPITGAAPNGKYVEYGHSGPTLISSDGRYVVFSSFASNLIEGDNNGVADVFVRDRKMKITQRISLTSQGKEADALSYTPAISADGRYIAFASKAQLAPNDKNNLRDIYMYDLKERSLELVSTSYNGAVIDGHCHEPVISGDGRFIAFYSEASNLVKGYSRGSIFVHDRIKKTTEVVSLASDGTMADAYSWHPTISADGRYIAFDSLAKNLVENDTNGTHDIFVRDRHTGTTKRVSVANDNTQSDNTSLYPRLSANGEYVSFTSHGSNLVKEDKNGKGSDIFIYHLADNKILIGNVDSKGQQIDGGFYHVINDDAQILVFSSRDQGALPSPPDKHNNYLFWVERTLD